MFKRKAVIDLRDNIKKFDFKKLNPYYWQFKLGKEILNKVFTNPSGQAQVNKMDQELLTNIIEEGRKNKVKELEIIVEKDMGLGLNYGYNGVNVKLGQYGKSNFKIKVKY